MTIDFNRYKSVRIVCAVVTLAALVAAARPGLAADTWLGEKCDLSVVGGSDKEEFLAFHRELSAALAKHDPTALSFLVNFPLRLNQNDGSLILLGNPTALQRQLPQVFNSRIVEAVRGQ